MSFYLHTASRTEDLLSQFMDLTRGRDPMKERFIVTSGKGMRTWLKQRISELTGISANLHFLSPERVAWDLAVPASFNDREFGSNPFSKERMAWKIRYALPSLASKYPEPFSLVTSFLEEDDPLKKIQLCWEIASVFDGYLHYRPELIEKWNKGARATGSRDEKWQALLWSEINSQIPSAPLSALVDEVGFASQVPDELWFFGFSPIPPVHLQSLAKYAESKEFHAFLLQPTEKYWREVLSNKEKIKLSATSEASERGGDLFLELGPPLLGALGKAWQKFILQLEERGVYEPNFVEPARQIGEKRNLHHLQDHFLAMPEGADFERIPFVRDDLSVQFHSCHSPQREVQVLQDFLLDQFNQNPDLRPNDVLVLCPNLQKYSALLKAAFDNPESQERRIPYGLCDREWRSESRVMDTFYHLLEFAEGRATARDFFTLVSRPVLCSTYGLDEDDLDVLRWWIEHTKIAWGFDGKHKESIGVPGFPENTWRQGLDRMMLGFCSGEVACEGFDELTPFDEIEGTRVNLLSKLTAIADDLQDLHRQCSQMHGPGHWKEVIQRFCLEKFFKDDSDTHDDLVELRKSLGVLTDETGVDADLEPLSVIRLHLERTLSDKSLFSRHLTHGVTFSSLRSARSIPAKIICLLGMDGGSFPGRTARPSFDLCKLSPAYSDRNQAEEDRLLVMESILCARDQIFFSFKGQSNRNNEEIPPSVVVEEILEQLDELIEFPNPGDFTTAKKAFLFKHCLQPFGKKYFQKKDVETDGERFFTHNGVRSFSRRNCEAALSLIKPREEKTPFCPDPISSSVEDSTSIQVDDLVRFWMGPSDYLLKRELLVSTWEEEFLLPENERLDACFRRDSSIKKRMISNRLAEGMNQDEAKKAEVFFEQLRKEGFFPPGKLGQALHSSLRGEISLILRRTPLKLDQSRPVVSSRVQIGSIVLEGESGRIFENSLPLIHPSKLKGRHCMEALIRHLWVNSHGPLAGQVKTVVGGLDQSLVFKPRDSVECISRLTRLLELFEVGLSRPLPFFPNASLDWLLQTQLLRTSKRAKKPALSCARDSWSSERGGEGHGFATTLCFPDDPWDEDETKKINEEIMGFLDDGGSFVQ